ncbi:unnamed protein product [Gongylonema pulchrum]|uniref:MFS domain-containing protein n=1 Tax=Gongylonema pulchrum TaxID=637853 RepID=A0A183DKJ5_9BILA|nr:unnamed protein product [Gongylonema pulchrum]
MTIVGGLIAAGGAFLSVLAFNIWHFLLAFAVVTGIGLSFCFNTAIVAVTYYFEVSEVTVSVELLRREMSKSLAK